MNYHALFSSASSARIDKINDALARLNFRQMPLLGEGERYQEPVVLFWTKDFKPEQVISDEDLLALAQAGRLISVIIEKVTLPNELPKHPVVDLVGWRGSERNPFFQDLRRNIEAAMQNAPPPKPQGPVWRFVKRMCAGLTVGVIIAFSFGFALNLLELQNNLCSINFNQPAVSDFCGNNGLGGKPNRDERISFEAWRPGSCEDLRNHIDKFGETGALYDRAAAMLDAKRPVTHESWGATQHRSIFSQSIAAQGVGSEEVAKLNAVDASKRTAEASCRAFAESDFFRFVDFEVLPANWDCMVLSSGHYCGFDGELICKLETLNRNTSEVCGPVE